MRHQKADGQTARCLRTTCGGLLQSNSHGHIFEYSRVKFRDWYVSKVVFPFCPRLNFDADADVRSLAFLSRLSEALYASLFYSHLKCEAGIGIGSSSTPS